MIGELEIDLDAIAFPIASVLHEVSTGGRAGCGRPRCVWSGAA
jgi:hypothetical protein